jgi:signal transduction histidine kinase
MAGGPGARDHFGITEASGPSTRPGSGSPRHGQDDDWGHWSWERYGGHGRHGGRHPRLRGPFRRNSDSRVLAGVCGGLSTATGIDVTVVRIGAVLAGMFFGFPVLMYAVAWLVLPLTTEKSNIFSRAVNDRRGIRMLIAVVPAIFGAQIVVSVLHIGYIGFIGWPLFLALGLGILIWRNASEPERVWITEDVVPLLRTGTGYRTRWAVILRLAVGMALAVAGILVLVLGHTSVAALRPVGGAFLVIAAIVVTLGPWWLSLLRDLMSERQARALAEERAQMAAHVHDSVLQTLALIQRSADDPQHVVRLARAQERELRAWLFEGRPPGTISEDATTLAEGVGLLQRQVEADHGITVHTVAVGDCELTEPMRALLHAAREATVNAAKWSGAPQVSLYVEVEPDAVMLFVRDRGQGFDPDAVPEGRQGIAQSIKGRMTRFGGSVVIRSSPGAGAEVELSMPRPLLVK